MPGESLNILMYDIATYTDGNIEKTSNSQVRLDACSDYSNTNSKYYYSRRHNFDRDLAFSTHCCLNASYSENCYILWIKRLKFKE